LLEDEEVHSKACPTPLIFPELQGCRPAPDRIPLPNLQTPEAKLH